MLRKASVFKQLFSSFILISVAYSQSLTSGDVAFTAFNADGDKDFAIVALKEIPAHTTLYFTDNEPNVDGSGFLDFNEGTLTWETGESNISEGTIIIFTDIDNDNNANFGASIGTLTTSTFDAGINPSASGDALYVVEGTPEGDNIRAWLAGIQNSEGFEGSNFNKTGLVMDSTFINFYSSANPDGGIYSGSRTSESSFSRYLSLLADNANWTTHNTDGESLLPISSEQFSIESSLPVELSSWIVQLRNGIVELSWTTESEIENLGFIIERTILGQTQNDGRFNVIASYKTDEECIGQGSTTDVHRYHFQDDAIDKDGLYRYRLSDVSYSGKITQYATQDVLVKQKDVNTPKLFEVTKLYPNPFNPIITIQIYLYEDLQLLSLSVFDINGIFIKSLYLGDTDKGLATFKWDGTNMNNENVPSGIYLINASSQSFHLTKRMTLLR